MVRCCLRMGEVVAGVYEKVLTVLLVEPDDSTRHIIAALLRKCNYNVAAVSDGLKAWETLKNKAHGIDLILTEAELPSVSGFSLLTLIMDHDNFKSIPVIVMSSHDSISMVFECMLKGAADFLIKPVRRNELRNLWQHVWRRNAISRSPQNLTLPQNKNGVAVENNAANNNSTGFVASTKKNKECSEKTSEAQSTCTSPSLEAESAYMENMQDTSQLKSSSNLSNIEESTKFEQESAKHNNKAGEKSVICASESEAARCNKTYKWTGLKLDQGYECSETENHDEVLRTELSRAKTHISTEIHECSDELAEPSTSREAMDLIATFEHFPKSTDEHCSFNGGNTIKFDFDTQLELSLGGEFPGSSCKPETEDRQALNHSNASAFSRYSSSKLLQPLFPTSSNTCAKLTNTSVNSHKSQKLSENTNTSHQYCGKTKNQENMITLILGQSGQVEPKLPNSQLGFFFATAGVTSDQVYQKESSPFPTSTSSHSNPESHNLECHHLSDDSTNTSDHNVSDQRKLDCSRHDSPVDCSGAYGSTGSGTDGNDTSAVVVAKNNPESFIDSCHQSYDGFRGTDSHHTSQREEALTKFRLKRKNRSYEKKVRYQSRKRLAEQRPRVKGQFVRQSAQ